MRPSKRAVDEMRAVSLERNVARYAEGSCLVKFGNTHVLCTASLEDKPPMWLRGQGRGWVTAEYAMLPRATHTRTRRESSSGKPSGRTQEIQRLIGRSLRAVTDLKMLGERQITVDCDVIQADGGTRCASITGAYVALALACRKLVKTGVIRTNPILSEVAAVSVGIIEGTSVLDLAYQEDSTADVDMNVVCTGSGKFIELQGTAEKEPFSREQMDEMLILAEIGVNRLFEIQRNALAG